MTILIFVVVLVVLIVVHEFGHFVAAKLFNMRVDEFGLGYPPRAMTLGTIGETRYTLNWLPFGGFVKIFGEDSLPKVEGEAPDPRVFGNQAKWHQAVVLVAGIAMNLVLAWAIFTGILMTTHWVSDHEFVAPLPFGVALVRGAEVTIQVTGAVAVGLANFFYGLFTFSADLSQVTGPVGIAGAVGEAASTGWESLLTLVALISINLALINLIPIPALDGGRLLFVCIEAVIRRPIKPAIANVVNATGFAALLLLMLVVTVSDIYRLLVS